MEKFKIIKKLGEGAFGNVWKCINTQNNEIVAIKRMKGQAKSWEECLSMPEVKSLQKLNNSPFIIKIKEMIHNKKENEVAIIFEYCEKNLFQEMQDRARKNQTWKESEIRSIMYQCIAAIQYMHKNNYMHRDIKPENYLINSAQSEQIQVKLGDFGLAKDFRTQGKFTEYVATRWYRAPELVLRSSTYDQSVDVFALGAIMAELYLGRPIFPGVNEIDQLTRIVTVLGTPSASSWPEGTQLAQKQGLVFPQVSGSSLRQTFQSGMRPDISEEAFGLLSQMLQYSSNQRISAQQCLQHPFFNDVSPNLKSMALSQANQRRFTRQRAGAVAESVTSIPKNDSGPRHMEGQRGSQSRPVNLNLAASGVGVIASPESKGGSRKFPNRLDQNNAYNGSGMTYGNIPQAQVYPNTVQPTRIKASSIVGYKQNSNQQEKHENLNPRMSKYAGGFSVGTAAQSNAVTPAQNPYQESNSTYNATTTRSKMNVMDAGQDDFLGKMMSSGDQIPTANKLTVKPFAGQGLPDPIISSQSVGMLNIPRSSSRIGSNAQNESPQKDPYQSRGLGGIGQNIMSVPKTNYDLTGKSREGGQRAQPLRPKPIGQKQFSNLGQSLIMSSNNASQNTNTRNDKEQVNDATANDYGSRQFIKF